MTTRNVPAKELRRHLAEFLDEVRSGESFEITRSGRPVGRLVPPDVEERSATVKEDQ